MRIDLTDSPDERDEAFVIAQTRAFNAAFTKEDVRSLCVFIRDDEGRIIGGLTAKTYWEYLEIQFLWVHEDHRDIGLASELIVTAETEAMKRGCKHAFLDTFSFQALGFYRKLGYSEFGRLSGFSGQHERYFLRKTLALPLDEQD
jgi:ribosomal protein S18 acetylase RimI-like enzyme